MNLTFKQRIIGAMLVVGLVPMTILTAVNTYFSYKSAQEMTTNGMDLVRTSIDYEIHDYFNRVKGDLLVISDNSQVHTALREFAAGVENADLAGVAGDSAADKARFAYQQQNTPDSKPGDEIGWQQKDAGARALQHLYISANPEKIGEKHKLEDAGVDVAYNRVHKIFHSDFKAYIDQFGYYDFFLIDAASKRVVYSVYKEIDFMARVDEGFLANTGLAKAVNRALVSSDPHAVFMADFEPYMPSYGAPAAFVAVPLIEDGKTIGAAAFQLPVDKISAVFTKAKELGETAEGFFFGQDFKLRSDALTDKNLKIGTVLPERVQPILGEVFTGFDGIKSFVGHTGDEVMGSLEQVELLDGVKWGMIVKVFVSEMMAPIYKMIWITVAMVLVTAVLNALFGLWISGRLVTPVQKLARGFFSGAEKVGQSTSQVGEAVSSMVAASEETSAQSTVIRKNSGEAAGYVNTVSTAVEELNISINDISQSIAETNVLIDDAVGKAKKTDDVVRKLGEASKKITEVVSLINDLAEQTNLLALNAAIEAARAGDAGRGFAVVADEVKKLASHTSQATVDIREQVQEIQDVSEQSVVALQAVVEAIHRIRDNATTVSAAVEEQSGVAKQIAGSVRDAAQRVQQVDDNMNGIEQAANDTGVAADQVSKSVGEVQGSFNEMKTQMQGVLDEMGVKH